MICRRKNLRLLYFLFIFVSCAVIYTSYTKQQTQRNVCLGSEREPQLLPADICQDVKDIITISEIKKVKQTELRKQVQYLQRCPWSGNDSAVLAIRSELQECCNAGRNLLVTQENTHIGDNITFETRKDKHIEVTKSLHEMFPKTSLFPDMPIRSCAVVGSGGILRNSCCGVEIDQADYIFRCNLAPMNYSDDIGTKTNLVTANPSLMIERYSSLMERRKPFMDMIKTYEPAPVLMAAFSFASISDLSFRTYYTLEDFGAKQTVIFYNPIYLANIELFWKNKGLVVRRLSSGLMVVSTALEICDEVTLYGFWPFAEDTNGNPIPHHYYNNRPPKPGVHSMPDEFFLYSQMHSKGILKLKVGKCF